MKLFVICDTSGSVSEAGKNMIMRTLVRSIEQYIRLGYGMADLRLVSWSSDARFVEWNTDHEYPPEMLASCGSACASVLVDLLGERPGAKILLMTDGFWSLDEEKVLMRWRKMLPDNTCRIIKIGADSNPRVKGTDVFTAEELFPALDLWLEGGRE